jgi:hypothetical protein
MQESEVTTVAMETIYTQIIHPRPSVTTKREIADWDLKRPDRVIATTRPEYRPHVASGLSEGDVEVHAVESKVDRRFMVAPRFSGIAQALDYHANYCWLGLPVTSSLWEEEQAAIEELCLEYGLGLIVCTKQIGEIIIEPGYRDGDFLSSYRRGKDVFDGLVKAIMRAS